MNGNVQVDVKKGAELQVLSNSSLHNRHMSSVLEMGGEQLKSKSSSEQQPGQICLQTPEGLSPHRHSMFLNHSCTAGIQHTPVNAINFCSLFKVVQTIFTLSLWGRFYVSHSKAVDGDIDY